jgi:hypothetical protein
MDFESDTTTVDGTDFISGYGVPMDPMDLLQCDSCQ